MQAGIIGAQVLTGKLGRSGGARAGGPGLKPTATAARFARGRMAANRPSVSRLNETATSSVSRLNREVRAAQLLWVEGEVSNLARPASGHVYFSLKDPARRCAARCSAPATARCASKPADGMKVLAYGRVSLYEPRGDYQLIVEALEAAGVGAAASRFEQLKRKLATRRACSMPSASARCRAAARASAW
jgi:hypothetical protein